MSTRKSFLLRLPPELLDALNHWASEDLRSLNGQIEFLLREALKKRGKPIPDMPADPGDASEISPS